MVAPKTQASRANTAARVRTQDGGSTTSARLAGTFSVAAQLPCEAVAARLRLGAEAPWPNSTCAASRRLQFGWSLVAAAGAPLFAQPRGTAAQLTWRVSPTNGEHDGGGFHFSRQQFGVSVSACSLGRRGRPPCRQPSAHPPLRHHDRFSARTITRTANALRVSPTRSQSSMANFQNGS